ncbi:uncharacterized protein LOC126484863 [Schistocerca serialis cubense]|uniref:uncharacterized protein LOC126484863 n=1 Tax=Schistocerca serialis cubense TaxID=2023355 RepID=UPI00214F5F8A|nr:uncharacterized protein LOC126484863 [Schistocerca serialis cubense]
MDDSEPNSTPFDVGTMLHTGQSPANQHEVKEMESKPNWQTVSSLMFAATVSQPDIMFAVSMVSRFVHNLDLDHWHAVIKIMKYVQGTRDLTIRYKADSNGQVAYSDTGYAGDCNSRQSTKGYMSCGPVTWCSHWQKCVSNSTMDAATKIV